LTAAVTLALIGVGGVVTSRGAGLAVPDWPNSFGYNMFRFPVSQWIGGIFYEHTHRLVATCLGVLVVALTRWLGGRRAQLPLAIIGLLEVLAGVALLKVAPGLQGAGHFLSGIGGVVLLAAAVWARNEPAPGALPMLGWLAFGLVQVQGLLGGLRVVLFKDEIGIFHATLAQLFFVLLCAIVLLTSSWWALDPRPSTLDAPRSTLHAAFQGFSGLDGARWLLIGATGLIFAQLILGATMRHQHAGLAIPDFPLAYGKLWPAMDPASVELYNQQRLEVMAVKPITAFQIGLQMTHRITAVVILAAVATCAWALRRFLGARHSMSKAALVWLGLILTQAIFGAATILTDKAADVATAHVLLGALSLAAGAMLSVVACRERGLARSEAKSAEPVFGGQPSAAANFR
jgi:cytochrome c oxidase assembly protein subunit 15